MDITARVIYWIIVGIALGGVSDLIACIITRMPERRRPVTLLVFILLVVITVYLVLLGADQSDSELINQQPARCCDLAEVYARFDSPRLADKDFGWIDSSFADLRLIGIDFSTFLT